MPTVGGDQRESPAPRKLRLHGWHEAHGATFRADRGVLVPWSYGAPDAARSLPPAGLLDLSNHGRLELVGADRHRFLGGLVTSAVADLEPEQGVYGFVTTIKGKVLADAVVSAFEDRLFLLLPPGRSRVVREHLTKYIVADRVEVLPLQDLVPLALLGEAIADRLPAGVWPETPWGGGVVELFGTQLPVSRHERLGAPALIAWVSSSIVEPVVEEWVKRLDLELVGAGALEPLRVEHGLPAFDIDYGEANLAQESGIEAIDFTKGCYLGQEVIARLHYRGQAPKVVRRIRWNAGSRVQTGAEVLFEGRAAGTVTTACSEADGAGVGLAMIQRRAAEVGTVVQVDGDEVEAMVEALG